MDHNDNKSTFDINFNCLSCVTVRVRVVFRKTDVVGDERFGHLSVSHLQSQVKNLRQMMVFMPGRGLDWSVLW